jgi:ABC-type branched-subunit amino acid transport system ATPase component
MNRLAVELRGVRKKYRFFSLDNIHLELHEGQIMGLIGPNGAGKSTTIRILMGLVHQGSAQTVRVHVRVVAATNQDLGQLVTKKLFRADLYYRLNVIPICLPPLRERVQGHIPPLTEFFVAKFAACLNKPIDFDSR